MFTFNVYANGTHEWLGAVRASSYTMAHVEASARFSVSFFLRMAM